MKLDFLKKGLVNTANFIPAYAVGEINMHPVALGVNLIGRLLSIYLCFQFNNEIDPKSLILSILFPALYIMYIIADKGIDDVLGKFDLEITDFTEVFDSDSEKCVERKGKDGDLKSVPADKEECEAVVGGRSDSKLQCDSIKVSKSPNPSDKRKRENAGVCKYIGGEETLRCSEFKYSNTCLGSGYDCVWNNYSEIGSVDNYREICKTYSKKEDIAVTDCPDICPYYLKGNPSFNVKKSPTHHHIRLLEPKLTNPARSAGQGAGPGRVDSNLVDTGGIIWEWTGGTYTAHGSYTPATATPPIFPEISADTIFYRYSGAHVGDPVGKEALIAVEFDANSDNSFYPLFSTDYRGEDIQLRFKDDQGSTLRSLNGKVVLVVPTNALSTAAGFQEAAQTFSGAPSGKFSINGPPIKIGGTNRETGTYTVIIKPDDLYDFYEREIDADSNGTKGDGEANIYGAPSSNKYTIQAVIQSDTANTAHCGKIWGDRGVTGWNVPGTDTLANLGGAGHIPQMSLDWGHWKTESGKPASSSSNYYDVKDVAFSGQLEGSCSN